MDIRDIMIELEMDGEASEAISFESVIKLIDEKEPCSRELFEDMPSLAKLMRSVHKQGFWKGVEFGRLMFMKIVENDEKLKIVRESEDYPDKIPDDFE